MPSILVADAFGAIGCRVRPRLLDAGQGDVWIRLPVRNRAGRRVGLAPTDMAAAGMGCQ